MEVGLCDIVFHDETDFSAVPRAGARRVPLLLRVHARPNSHVLNMFTRGCIWDCVLLHLHSIPKKMSNETRSTVALSSRSIQTFSDLKTKVLKGKAAEANRMSRIVLRMSIPMS